MAHRFFSIQTIMAQAHGTNGTRVAGAPYERMPSDTALLVNLDGLAAENPTAARDAAQLIHDKLVQLQGDMRTIVIPLILDALPPDFTTDPKSSAPRCHYGLRTKFEEIAVIVNAIGRYCNNREQIDGAKAAVNDLIERLSVRLVCLDQEIAKGRKIVSDLGAVEAAKRNDAA